MSVPVANFAIEYVARYLTGQISQMPSNQGFGCKRIEEDVPDFHYAECEGMHMEGENNSYIVLGRDRPGSIFSGLGGDGETNCGMIDLVAGRMSSTIIRKLSNFKKLSKSEQERVSKLAQENPNAEEAKKYFVTKSNTTVGNNWFTDAARVYITQRAEDIDKYLGFSNDLGPDSTHLSAVVIKSDCTRIVGRESVRIYAGGAKSVEGAGTEKGERLSNDTFPGHSTIELIADGHEENRQPAVLGDNLVLYLKAQKKVDNMKFQILKNLQDQILRLSNAMIFATYGTYGAAHFVHIIDSLNNLSKQWAEMVNEGVNEIQYLDEAIIPGKHSILSKRVYIT